MIRRHRRSHVRTFNPHRRFALVTAFATLLLMLILILIFRTWDYVFIWLIAINIVTFFTFRYDKVAASLSAMRVPEAILLMQTLLGGFIGAITAQIFYRHKMQNASFRMFFWPCVAISAALVAIYYLVICPECR